MGEKREAADLVAATFQAMRDRVMAVVGRNSVGDKIPEWFVVEMSLPAGEFLAGPFQSRPEAVQAVDAMTARAAIAALAEAGYVIVPREPTEAMVRAGTALFSPKAEYHGADAEVVWDAMLGAASQLTE